MVIMLVGRAVRQRHCRGSRSFAAGDGMARSQGVRLRFLLRRMASARLLLASVLLTALVTSAFLAGMADFAAGTLTAAAQRRVAASPAASVQVSSTASDAQAGQASQLIRASLRSAFGPAGLRIQGALWSDPLDVHGLPVTGPAAATAIAEVAVLPGFTGQAKLIQGSWPARPRPGQPYQVTAPSVSARQLGLRTGQLLSLTDGDTGAAVRVVITGFYTARDPAARYWGLDVLPPGGISVQQGFRSYGPFIAAPGVFAAGLLPVGQRSWLAQPASARIPPGLMEPTAVRISRTAAALSQSQGLGGIVVSTDMPQLLGTVSSGFAVARSVLAIASLELLLVAMTTMALAAGLLASRREEESALLIARGVTRTQLAGLSLAEAAGLCIVAAAAGAALGPALARLLAAGLAGGQSGTGASAGLWPSALVAALGVILLTRPAAGPARLAGLAARRHRPPALGIATRAGADAAILVLAGLMAWQLRQYSAVTRTASGSLSIDPVLVAAPALILAGGALIPLRLLPAIARLADRLAARGDRLVGALTAWEISRRPIRQAGPALLAALAVAAGTLALSQYQSWHQSALAQAAQIAGADVRLQAPLPGGSARLPAVLAEPAVTAAMPVSEFNAGLGGQMVAVDASTAARVVLLRSDQARQPAAALWRLIVPPGPAPGVRVAGEPGRIAVRVAVSQAPSRWQPGTLLLTMSVQAADGVVYQLPAAALAAGSQRQLVTASVPAAARASYPLRLLGLSVSYQMPLAAPAGPAPRLTLVISDLDAAGGQATLRPFAAGSALAGWQLTAQAAANPDASGPDQPPAAAAAAAPGGGLNISVSPGYGELVARAGLPPLAVTAAVSLTAGPGPRAIPGIATTSFLTASGDAVGATVSASAGGTNVPVRIVAAVRSFPAAGQGGTLIVDQQAIQEVLAGAAAAALPVTSWWLSTSHGQLPGGLPPGVQLTSARQLADQILGDPFSRAPQQAELALIAAAALLAMLGFGVSVTASRDERRPRVALLAALGVPAGSQLRQLCLEQLLLAGPAAAAGLLIGAVAARLLVPAVVLSPAAARPQPPALAYLPLWWAIALALAITIVPVAAAAIAACGRPDPAAELRSAGTA
jgi:hypothetical protein